MVHYIGRTVKVQRLTGAQVYAVPDELPDGTRVLIVAFDHGTLTVEHQGKAYTIFLACVDQSSYEPPL